MKRWVFTVLAAGSLLVFVAVVVLWVRSYRVRDWVDYTRTDGPGRRWSCDTVVSNSGCLYVSAQRFAFEGDGLAEAYAKDVGNAEGLVHRALQPGENGLTRGSMLSRVGFEVVLESDVPDVRCTFDFHRAFVPHWFVAAVALVIPARWGYVRLRRRRREVGRLCAACGYDLRATPERCPECGAVPASAST